MKFKYKCSRPKIHPRRQRKLFPCASSVYLSWYDQMITFIFYQEASPGTLLRSSRWHCMAGCSFLTLFIPSLILRGSFVHCHWRQLSPPVDTNPLVWFEDRRKVLCLKRYREREYRRDRGLTKAWREHVRKTFRIGLPCGISLNTICSLRGSGQASSRWEMDAQFLSVLLLRLPSFTCDVSPHVCDARLAM